jgi:hypothetical protein
MEGEATINSHRRHSNSRDTLASNSRAWPWSPLIIKAMRMSRQSHERSRALCGIDLLINWRQGLEEAMIMNYKLYYIRLNEL